jgi:diguanylate cyclase (GGDEF)-like protein/PAS domain S-box-containing protein
VLEQPVVRNGSGMKWRRRSSRAVGADSSTSPTATGDTSADESSGLPAGAAGLAPGAGDTDTFNSVTEAFLRLPDAIVMVDMEGTIVWGNRSAEQTFGRSFDDWVGRSGLDLVHPDDHELVLRSLVSIQGKDIGSPIELRIRAASGWRLVEVVGTTVHWFGQRVILLSLRDLTERRRYELASGREERFRSLVHNAGSIIMLVSSVGTLESVSGAITRLLGHDPEQLEQRPLLDIVDPADRTKLAGALTAASHGASSAHPVGARIRLLRHDGSEVVPFEMSIVDLLDDPTVEGFVISAHDASVQARTEHELGQALSLLTATLDSTADGILVIDNDGLITTFNGRFSETWHIPEQEWKPGDQATKLGFVLEQLVNAEAFLATWRQLGENPEMETFDSLEFKDGRVVELYSKAQRIEGEIVGRVWSFRDTTDRTRLEDELEYRAFHDPLTGLANKALFQDRLEHALARAEQTGSHLAVLFIDLDDFKTVNDSLGHSEGDLLLKRVATTLVECLRPLDTAARMGGDEFAILIEDVQSRDDITELAERILESLRPLVLLGSKAVSSAGSVGIAFDVEGMTTEQLLRNADIAMYKAKEAGKNRYEVYRDEMHALVLARIELEDELRAAILGGNLITHYQPIFDLRTSAVVGFEALVRWSHPRGGLVDPRLFVSIAEEMGLVGEIDTFVLRSACRQAYDWRAEGLGGPGFAMSVNVSAGRLFDPGLAERIAEDVELSGFDPSSLMLEITESEVLTESEAIVRNLSALRALGIRIALDDFGTGFSSLSHLDRLQVDIVKIDRSFVQGLGTKDDTRSMAAAMIQLARTLGYDTIAEGVEKRSQEASLRALGCRLAQGYQLGRPADAEQTRLLLVTDDRREQLAEHLGHPQQPGG